MYRYRIYPSNKQKERLINSFNICKEVYNELLALNRKLLITNKFDFNSLVMDLKCCNPRLKNIHSQVLQNVSDRLHKSFASFFRKVKENIKEKGFPRFKSKVNSITYPQVGFKILSNKRIKLSKIGSIPIVLHRVPKGKIKTLTIKINKAGQWFAFFSCELPYINIVNLSTAKIGIDVGLESFATFSDGNKIENPKYLIKSEKMLKRLQRKLSKKRLRSNNWKKARFKLARQYVKVTNQRNDFLHKLSRNIVNKYVTIAVENLKINNMIKNHHLAKSINDVSWNRFIQMLSYKAVTSGGMLIKVNPSNTSKTCRRYCKTFFEGSCR